jgi:hypothetical protein
VTDYTEIARREDTAKAWATAWFWQANDSETQRECAEQVMVAARREDTAEAWWQAWFCQRPDSVSQRECRCMAARLTLPGRG